MRLTVSPTWRRGFVLAIGLLGLGYAGAVLIVVPQSPDLGLKCAFSPVVIAADLDYLQDVPDHPLRGDTLLLVGDFPIHSDNQLWAQVLLQRALGKLQGADPGLAGWRPGPDGRTQVRVRFAHDGRLTQSWIPLRTLPLRDLVPSALWFFLKFGLFLVGALVFWKRPADRSAAQFFLVCTVTLGAYMGGYHWVRLAARPLFLLPFIAFAALLPAVSLHFYLLFPRPKSFLQRRPGRTLAAVYGPPAAFLLVLVAGYWRVRSAIHSASAGAAAEADAWSFLRHVILIYLVVGALWYLASVSCLVHSFRSARPGIERNQVRWILLGSLVALVPIGYTFYLIEWAPDDFGAGKGLWPMFAASVCFTLAFAVSISRYRLLQLDQLVSSGASYFLISFTVGLAYYAVVFLGMLFAGSRIVAEPLAQAFTVSSTALVLLLLLNLARSRLKRALDRRFARDKYQIDRTLRRMGAAIDQLVEPPTLARRLLHASAEILRVSRGAVYLREGDPPLFRLAGSLGPEPPLALLASGCPLVEAVQDRGVFTCRPQAPRAGDPAERQLHFLGGEVAQALAHEGKLLALLVLGPKDLGVYGPDDLNVLAAFAQLTALALESAEGRHTIETLNRDLRSKVEKISEQQRRILALQSQLMRQAAPENGTSSTAVGQGPGTPAAVAPVKPGMIVGSSATMRELLDMARKVSATQSSVLIHGESGTGKELLARALHDNSPRAGKSFVKVHCAALSPGLLESELFGHVKGAFTGAHRDKVGRFELANGGTLFLDEIGDISLEVQTKLLRVLQERTFERVGSSDPVQVDVRVIAASHQNLEELIRRERFREDLYYRLKVIDITVPPLRDRREDIAELAIHFLAAYARRCGKAVTQIDDDALAALKGYHWPGNIRQLENVIERAVVMADGPTIGVQELPTELLRHADGHPSPRGGRIPSEPLPTPPRGIRLERAERDRRERERLVRALAAAKGNKAEAARALGLARSTLISRLNKYGLS